MKVINHPTADERARLLFRPAIQRRKIEEEVRRIISRVRTGGNNEIFALGRELDGVDLSQLEVTKDEFDSAERTVPEALKNAIALAQANIAKFHGAEDRSGYRVEVMPGVVCWKRWLPIERVGLYIPSGTAPLFSTVLMLAIPAQLAGCREIVLCSPPDVNGNLHPAIVHAASTTGVTRLFKIGGAQAIAAMAFGTESIPKVDKIFGPGNQFVTEAKLQVLGSRVAIDMPAGPSEVAVLADNSAIPQFVAADLISQAEHGPDSQVMLVSTSTELIENVLAEVKTQIRSLPRREIAAQALKNSFVVAVGTLDEGLDLLNEYAPEHLILACGKADEYAEKVRNAGSVFLGNYSCESAGDYAAGTNHTLPTNGAARAYSGLSVLSFMRSVTFQSLSADGIRSLGPAIQIMAEAEGLDAHKKAVSIRLQKLFGGRGDL